MTLGIRRGETRLSVAVTPRIIASSALPSGQLVGAAYLLRIPSFATEGTAQRVHELVRAAQSAGASRLIVDLRGNRGGLVSEATAVSAAFAPKLAGQTLEFLDAQDYTFFYQTSGVVGQVAVRGVCFSGNQPLTTIQNPALWTGPLDVLVNADSASASEVVTETLQKVGASALGEVDGGRRQHRHPDRHSAGEPGPERHGGAQPGAGRPVPDGQSRAECDGGRRPEGAGARQRSAAPSGADQGTVKLTGR